MSKPDKSKMLRLIRRNIQTYGFHIYVVGESEVLRFAYTIGLEESVGAELVFAGAIYYMCDQVKAILNTIREGLISSGGVECAMVSETNGSFTLREVHRSWTQRLLLGAIDYYGSDDIRAYQIVPDQHHWTIDTPNMAREWCATTEPIWRWLRDEWPFPVPSKSTVVTNLDALRGARITEASRWGDDEWEMFAGSGSGVSYGEARVVPLGCVLGADPSLAPVLDLEVGQGIWRDNSVGDWHFADGRSRKTPD